VGIMTGTQSDTIDSGNHVEGDGSFDALIAGIIEGRYQKPFEAVKVGKKCMLETKLLTAEDAVRELDTAEQASVDTVAASGKALQEDATNTKKDVVGATKRAKAEQQGKNIWDDAPAEVITVFEALHKGKESKAQIARDNNTSTRTMQRWQEKYDFDGWAKKTGERFDIYYDGKANINLIKAHRSVMRTGLKEAKEAVEAGGLLFENITAQDVDEVTRIVGQIGLVIVQHGSTPVPEQPETKEETSAPKAPAKKGGIREQGQDLYGAWQKAGGEASAETFQHLLDFKKAKKKGWASLGFNAVQIKKIERATNKLG
jgi:ribosomal protein L7/L12